MSPWITLHLAAIVPALAIGPIVLFRKKGDPWHKALERIWVGLMIVGSLLSFGILSEGRLSWLHGLSLLTLFMVITGLRAAREGDIRSHQRKMVGSYLGMLIAFAFTLRPGRILGDWVRALFP